MAFTGKKYGKSRSASVATCPWRPWRPWRPWAPTPEAITGGATEIHSIGICQLCQQKFHHLRVCVGEIQIPNLGLNIA